MTHVTCCILLLTTAFCGRSAGRDADSRLNVDGDAEHVVPLGASGPTLAGWPFDQDEAAEQQTLWAAHARVPVQVTNGLGMSLRLIPAGEFMMGTAESADAMARIFPGTQELLFQGEYPRYRVRVPKPFFLGAHEVTVGQFRKFVSDTDYVTEAEKESEGIWGWNDAEGKFERNTTYNWRHPGFTQDDNCPVVNVSWNDAVAFCRWLSWKEQREYRLPTEAEWEFACRAGADTHFFNGDDPEQLSAVGNVSDATMKEKSPEAVTITARDDHLFVAPVGQFQANPFGLYDMHGNASELCAAAHQSYLERILQTTDQLDLRIALTLAYAVSADDQQYRGFDLSDLALIDSEGASSDWCKSTHQLKVMLLEFPHGECPNCQKYAVIYQELIAKYAGPRIRFDLVNILPERVEEQFHSAYSELFTPLTDVDNVLEKELDISECPVVVIADASNRIVAVFRGDGCLRTPVEAVIAATLQNERLPSRKMALFKAEKHLQSTVFAATVPVPLSPSDCVSVRGGNWHCVPAGTRSASREAVSPNLGFCTVGFRVALDAD